VDVVASRNFLTKNQDGLCHDTFCTKSFHGVILNQNPHASRELVAELCPKEKALK
jgi:CobQ-like glutamine amidotransferase family enzyme